jgi:hypothetical protein
MATKIYNWGILAPGRIVKKIASELMQPGNAWFYALDQEIRNVQSQSLIKTMHNIRQKAGIIYPRE